MYLGAGSGLSRVLFVVSSSVSTNSGSQRNLYPSCCVHCIAWVPLFTLTTKTFGTRGYSFTVRDQDRLYGGGATPSSGNGRSGNLILCSVHTA